MSTVKLTAFAIYRVHGTPGAKDSTIETLYGTSEAEFGPGNMVRLVADSVPFHAESFKGKAPKAGCGLLMLYGTRDSLESIFYWRTRARELKAEFVSAEFEFDIGDIEVGLMDRDILVNKRGRKDDESTVRDYRFLNFGRMTASFKEDVLEKFANYVEADGGDPNVDMKELADIGKRPDLFDRLLIKKAGSGSHEEDPQLSGLDVFVIPILDNPANPKRARQLAYAKVGAPVVSVVQGSTEAEIVLPLWWDTCHK